MVSPPTAPVLVSDVPALIAALKACAVSCVVTLAPGDWRNVNLDHIVSHATITGPNAVLHDLNLTNSSDLTFSNLDFSTAGAAPGPYGALNDNWFRVVHSSNITFDKIKAHGDPRGTLKDTANAFFIRFSDKITISNSDFSHLHNGIGFLNDTHLTISHNYFHNLFDDAMRGGEVGWLHIDSNFCQSNHPDKTDTDHPDCLQLWTSNTKTASHDITVTNNRYDRGTGNSTQFVFLGNEASIPYENVTITGNESYGAGWNGIAVGDARNVTIKENRIIPSCRLENGQVTVSRIVIGKLDGAVVADNIAGAMIERAPSTGKTQYNNRDAGCADHSPF